MSEISETERINWFEEAIKKEHIKYYEYSQFNNIKKIGSGAFSNVYRANWKGTGKVLALKAFFRRVNNEYISVKEIINEINSQRKVDFHENIIRFFGISVKNENDNPLPQDKEYVMVMELADGGLLRNHLEKYFKDLTWTDKFNLAFQLASAVLCLHEEGIVHCDLHSSNILINQNTIKIADFGLSKRIEEPSFSDIIGVIPYLDPKIFHNNSTQKSQKYQLNEKSDVYSVGVLLWEISSGQTPFYGKSYETDLIMEILQGLRETPIPNTPAEYANLYKACWEDDPNNRPHIREVVKTLKAFIPQKNIGNYQKSKSIIDNNDLEDYDSKFLQLELSQLEQFLDITKNDSEIVTELVTLFIKITNEGKTRDQRKKILDHYLSSNDFTIEKVYEWLNNNNNYMTDPNYIFFMGYLKFSGFGTTLDLKKAFNYFYDASLNNRHTTAQYYLGICFENGFGIKKDQNAFYCYRQAANDGHAIAQYYMGNFYQFGIYTDKNDNQAYYYYELSAKSEFSCGINILGYCYLKGIGTSIDKKKAFELYLKAANMNNNVAQYNVAICFDDGIGTKKNSDTAKEWYKKSADNGYDNARKKLPPSENEEKEIEKDEHIIEQWKLNHGFFLDGSSIQPSKQAVLADNGELNISLYQGEPIVYININDPKSPENCLTFDKDNNVRFNDTLKQLDICINFPVVEVTYKADPVKNFYMCEEENLHDLYGHILAKEFLAGGQLFIKDFNLASEKQVEILKFYLALAYNSAKTDDGIQINNKSFDFDFLPRIETSSEKEIKTPKELAKWMKDLYQENIIEIISYNNLNSISQLKKLGKGTLNEKQPGVANFKKKSNLNDWVGNTVYAKLVRWIKKFRLLQGLVISKSYKIENSKKIAINLFEVPKVNLINNSYFEIINSTTKLEENLVSNNIFSIKNIRSFPFIKTDDLNDNVNVHLVIKRERYEILISKDYIKPSNEFNNAIEEALDSKEPFHKLQGVFNEYGHLFPLRIILGKSLKNNTTADFFGTFEKINLKLPTGSLQSYLSNLNISYLLTQEGSMIENDGLDNWIQNTNEELEIIELDEIISLYDILKLEQKRKIDIILNNNNNQDNLKIIMTGISDLKDLDNNDDTEYYMQIDIEKPLEDENYEVFGSIITKNGENAKDNLKIENFLVKFELYDVHGFSVTIKKLEETSVDITKCYILWIIVGNPLKLSVFEPNNRKVQVDCIKEYIVLKPDETIYSIKTPFPLSQGYTILINATKSKNIIKLAKWSYNSIYFQIIKSTYNDSTNFSEAEHNSSEVETDIDIDLHICILRPNDKSLTIDYEYSLDLIGYILTKENFDDDRFEIESFVDGDILDLSKGEPITGNLSKQANVNRPINFSKPIHFSKPFSKLIRFK